MRAAFDLTGRTFGRLRALSLSPLRASDGARRWVCECECGKKTVLRQRALILARPTTSCGCGVKNGAVERFTRHGGTRRNGKKTPEFLAWRQMRTACSNPKNPRYASIGGAGIVVCDAWQSDFAAFLADMGPRPSGKYYLWRRDLSAPFDPQNTYWATGRKPYMRVRMIRHEGVQMTQTEVARRLGVSGPTVAYRLRTGKNPDGTPIDPMARGSAI